MKVTVRNKSNKKRSKEAIKELKEFTFFVARKLGIEKKIKKVSLIYHKDFYGYYPKGKPLYGFYKMFNHQNVFIYLAKHWDISQWDRKIAIVHELTHVKQMVEKRLIISKNFKEAKWNGVLNTTWRKWKSKEYDQLPDWKKNRYTKRLFPWEGEVQDNTDLYRSNKL